MITIESKEDIEILLEFFKLLNVENSKSESEDLDEVLLKIEQIEQVLTGITDEIQVIKSNLQEDDSVEKSIKTVRTYSEEYTEYQIEALNEDGTFKKAVNRGKPFSFTIRHILKLKRLIPRIDEYPTFRRLHQEFKDLYPNSSSNFIKLCYFVEIGFFDKYISEWEQKQANTFFRDNQVVVQIENNPQKRREQGWI